jgi:hypothetical protein
VLRNLNVNPRAEPEADLGVEGLEELASGPERRCKRLIEHSQAVIDRGVVSVMKFLHDESEQTWPTLLRGTYSFAIKRGQNVT